MELYGVHHGGDYQFAGVSLSKMEVEPAEEMLQAIEDLPKGSVIGVEAVHPEDLEGDPDNIAFREEDIQYWQDIIDTCQDAGHSVAYLDSLDIHKRAALKRVDLQGLESSLYGGNYVITPGNERTVAEILFSLEAQINYLYAVAREDFIIRKLEEARPQMAVIGLAHADYVMLNPELVERLGVDEYKKALLDAPELSLMDLALSERRYQAYQYLKQSPPEESALRERELAIRTYHAATLGRIAIGCEPAWIGSWEPTNRPYGLFEVYPTSPTEGKIEDRLGTAAYTGEFGDNTMSFTKKYVATTTLDPTAVTEAVDYEAIRVSDDEYQGTWLTYGMKGKFIIRRGYHLYDAAETEFGQQKLF